MNKMELKNLDLMLYEETLPCGLTIHIVPKTSVNNIYVSLSTRFGEQDKSFIPYGEKKMLHVENGIAHFLEHKVFEMENGEDPFAFFSLHGADANASTTLDKTTYVFSTVSHFIPTLNYLLDFVFSPYFTDENVEKEKEIIAEELSMYEDDPLSKLMEVSLLNSFQKDPVRYYIGGTKESISTITKEKLMSCFDTFYHPSNMFLVITGNVDPTETILTIKQNLENKKFEKRDTVVRKNYVEPDLVTKEEEVLYKNVVIPKIAVNFKLNYKKIKKDDFFDLKMALTILFQSKFSITSLFNEEAKRKNIIQSGVGFNLTYTSSHILFTILGESEKEDVFIEEIKEEMHKNNITEEEFERKKKVMISSYIYMSDNVYAFNNKIVSDIMDYKKVICDDISRIHHFTFDKFEKLLSKINFDTVSTVIIKNKEKG